MKVTPVSLGGPTPLQANFGIQRLSSELADIGPMSFLLNKTLQHIRWELFCLKCVESVGLLVVFSRFSLM